MQSTTSPAPARYAIELLQKGTQQSIEEFNHLAKDPQNFPEWRPEQGDNASMLTLQPQNCPDPAELRKDIPRYSKDTIREHNRAEAAKLLIHNCELTNFRIWIEVSLTLCHAHDARFENIQTSAIKLTNSTFESCLFRNLTAMSISNCTFHNCIFQDIKEFHSFGVTHSHFIDCRFVDVALNESDLTGTAFRTTSAPKPIDDTYSVNSARALRATTLHQVSFDQARLQGTIFHHAFTSNCSFTNAIADETTLFLVTDTDSRFEGFPYRSVRTRASTCDHIAFTIRKHYWQDRFAIPQSTFMGALRKYVAKCFWFSFGYSLNIYRQIIVAIIITTFFSLLVYLHSQNHGFNGIEPRWATSSGPEDFFSVSRLTRATYFVIVCMTTLGFGDISSAYSHVYSHILVMAIVTSGYGLLGTLIARLITLINWPD